MPSTLRLPQRFETFLLWIQRFLLAWRQLLLHPSEFIRLSIDERKRRYLPAWQFFTASLVVMTIFSDSLG